MKNRMILTPYFLDGALTGLRDLAGGDWRVVETQLTGSDTQGRMIDLYGRLAQEVRAAVENGERPVSIAGDCCTTIGVLAGLQQAGLEPTLIWIDAHGDFNTWETSPSGFLGGMPLAMLVGRGEVRMSEAVGQEPLGEADVILTDGRDLDPQEKVALENSAVEHLPEVRMLLERPLPVGPIYVHFDVDVIDPEEAPAMNYLAPYGVRVEELQTVFEYLAQSGQVAAVSVSTWNPDLDEDGRSQAAAMRLLDCLIG